MPLNRQAEARFMAAALRVSGVERSQPVIGIEFMNS
jgi:hypothetical protein